MPVINHATVLIVDDNFDFHTVATAALTRSGYQVKSLYDVSNDDLAQAAATCDIILLDVDLPSDSGIEIARRMKSDAHIRYIPIILISGNADIDILYTDSGADSYLVKPFTTAVLVNEVERLLDNAHAQSAVV